MPRQIMPNRHNGFVHWLKAVGKESSVDRPFSPKGNAKGLHTPLIAISDNLYRSSFLVAREAFEAVFKGGVISSPKAAI